MTKRGPFKQQMLEILKARDVPVSTVVDVGICRGTPELMQAYSKCHHLLFEPVEEFQDPIRHNYRNLDYELHQVAVSDTPGTISLKTAAVLPGMAVSHSSMVAGSGAETGLREVPMVTLDSFLANRSDLQEPFLLKIDIDGQELKVLRGATETLKRCSVVIVECQRAQLAERIATVQRAGFTLFDLSEPCYYDKALWQCDAVLLRRDIMNAKFESISGSVAPGKYEKFG